MEYGYTQQLWSPPRGRTLEEVRACLQRMGLSYAQGIEHTAVVRDGTGAVAATASLEGHVIKCVAVDPDAQGAGLTATVVTALRQKALEQGLRRLFLYTKARAEKALLMEDRRGGFDAWAEELRAPDASGTIGAAVMNCNPMTLGHLYLIEEAAKRCGHLYLLIVSEDRSAVPAGDRRRIVEATAAHLPNVSVSGTGQYLISSATFPDYFLKDKSRAGDVWTDLDIAVFCRLAEKLGITRRFVGSEPFCPVTSAYNRAMARKLPEKGIELVELPRLEQGGTAISATAVRKLLRAGRWEDIRPLVPEATFAYFSAPENRERFLTRDV